MAAPPPSGAVRPKGELMDGMTMSPESMQFNYGIVMFSRIYVSIVAGCVAGILGLTNAAGFAAYVISALLVPLVFQLKMGFNTRRYFMTWQRYALDGAFAGILSFILFWTLIYDVVYLF